MYACEVIHLLSKINKLASFQQPAFALEITGREAQPDDPERARAPPALNSRPMVLSECPFYMVLGTMGRLRSGRGVNNDKPTGRDGSLS